MGTENLLEIFKETEALLEGHFKLSSGRHADKYLQCARALQFPAKARILGQALAEKLKKANPDLVVSPALGGLIIGHEVAAHCHVPFVFTERKDGQMTLRRGFTIPDHAKVLIIEDVITTGKSTAEVVDVVENFNAEIVGIGCLANRSTQRLNLPHQPEALLRLKFDNWAPDECPLCKKNIPLTSPGSRFSNR